MKPQIDIFDGTGKSEHYQILIDAIKHLGNYKPGTEFRRCNASEKFIEGLKSRTSRTQEGFDLADLINTSFKNELFRLPTQKIILINEPGHHEGRTHRGLTGGFEVNGKGEYKGTIALTTSGLDLDEFYAVSCHELGHIYGATSREKGIINNGGRHCVDKTCAMHMPSFNHRTRNRRISQTPMYCPECRDGLRKF